MTQVRGSLESNLSGKFGEMVFVQMNGKTYMRRAPRRKKDSSTPAMLLNQQRFAQVMEFCGLFKDTVIPRIWNSAAVNTSGFRLFQKSNSPAFAKDGSLMDAKLLKFSTGKLTLPQGLQAGRAEIGGSVIEVSWHEDLQLGGIHLQDELLVISSGEGQYSEILATGILRKDLHGSFELPELSSPTSHIYLFFESKDRRNHSESICFEI